jgi:hypothetical protein
MVTLWPADRTFIATGWVRDATDPSDTPAAVTDLRSGDLRLNTRQRGPRGVSDKGGLPWAG